MAPPFSRSLRHTLAYAGVAATLVAAGACGRSQLQARGRPPGSAEGGGGSGGQPGGGGLGGGGEGGAGAGGEGTGGAFVPGKLAYVHSANWLFQLDLDFSILNSVGPFVGCVDNVVDIAVDQDARIYATTFGGSYEVDPETVECTPLGEGSMTSLAMVPAGTVDPDREALVGFSEDQYIRIDLDTGATSLIGQLGADYSSSGDMVMFGGKAYLTVRGAECDDCLAEVDPATGALVTILGKVGYPSVYGAVAWEDRVLGLTDGGQLLQLDIATGQGTPLAIKGAPSGISFWGAASPTIE